MRTYDKYVLARVENFPSEQITGTKYHLSDMATTTDPCYFGYVDADGNWFIMELSESSGTARYVKGTSSYTTAWTNRATQTYGYYNAVF